MALGSSCLHENTSHYINPLKKWRNERPNIWFFKSLDLRHRTVINIATILNDLINLIFNKLINNKIMSALFKKTIYIIGIHYYLSPWLMM